VGWGIDWIDLAQDRDVWRALMNAVMHGGGGGGSKLYKKIIIRKIFVIFNKEPDVRCFDPTGFKT